MTKIKICGLQRMEDITYVNKYLPEYVGFVFANSKRQVHDLQAKQMKAALAEGIQAVGVFVNEPIGHIIYLCKEHIIDVVQLHGDEDEIYINKLRTLIQNPIIKAIRVQTTEQIEEMQGLPCEYLLLDTFVKNLYGGSGITFERDLIPKKCKPFFLAGGLNKENIIEAIRDCEPFCVDFSSCVEIDGLKNEYKIKEIVGLIRNNT